MMETVFSQAGWWAGHGVAALLCLAGIFISLLSFTGAWLVCLAAGLCLWVRPDDTPGWWTVAAFLAISALLEAFDFFAGHLGVTRRGGSAAAGWAALAGGLLGMLAGSILPLPLIGSLFGMMGGSFAFAFWVERRRLEHGGEAARIARGAVYARLAVMFLKTVAALGMSAYLWYSLLST